MKVLIVDDEAPARERLRSLLQEIGPPYEVAGEAGNGLEALDKCSDSEVDLVLMDIRMPGMDGLQAAAVLAEREMPPAVIFTTAYEEHALEAFNGNAADYLLKPIRLERLQNALARARTLTRVQVQALKQEEKRAGSFISANIRGGVRRIPLEEIIYLQADHKYVSAFCQGEEILLEEPLKFFEERFQGHFLRIHRNALVARNRFVGLEKRGDGQSLARMEGTDTRLPVSRRHLAEVRRWLKSG